MKRNEIKVRTQVKVKGWKERQLAGTVGGAGNSWSWGHELEPHTGCGDYYKSF